VYSPYIQLEFLERLLLIDLCNLLLVLIFVAFRHIYPKNETMKDVKKALSGKNIEFSHLKKWNAERCRDLLF